MIEKLLGLGLLVAGISLALLCIASFWIPKELGWKEKLAGLTPLMRELFWTYSLYVFMCHILFATLALGFSDWLMSQTPAAAIVSGFICLWWLIRLYLQFFGFDFGEVEKTRFTAFAKHTLTLLFIGLVLVFGTAVFWNLGWIEGGA